MLLPDIQHRLCGSIWTQALEPHRVIGLSLSRICLVRRHHVPRGCPSAESGTHEECLRTQPAALRRPGRGHSRVSRAWRLRVPLFPVAHCSTETVTLHRCVVQLQAVPNTRNEVSRKRLAMMLHHLFHGRPPRPRDASVCPLDTGGLIGVRRDLADRLESFFYSLSCSSGSTSGALARTAKSLSRLPRLARSVR